MGFPRLMGKLQSLWSSIGSPNMGISLLSSTHIRHHKSLKSSLKQYFGFMGYPLSLCVTETQHFMSLFWRRLFRLNGTNFRFSSAYHPQTDVVNRTIEMYLRCFSSSFPKQWVKWLSWVKLCYNTSFHSPTKHSPFGVVYGRPSPSLLSYILGTTQAAVVEEALVARDTVLRDVRRQLIRAQNRMKQVYDKNHTEREFFYG
jgi:hypothetical protein